MTNRGELLAVYSVGHYGKVLTESDEIDMVELEDLRIVPATRWTYHDGGASPVPEGLVVDVIQRSGKTSSDVISGGVYADYKAPITHDKLHEVIAYRITGVDLAGGFTDDPGEVTE